MRILVISVALLASAALRAAGVPGSLESFFDYDVVIAPSLSSDGTKLAYLTSSGRDLALAVYHLDSGQGEVLCRVDSHTSSFSWKGNDRILFAESLYNETLLRSVTLGQHSLNTFPGFGDRRKIGSVFDWLPADSKHILVRKGLIGLMDIETGEIKDTQPVESMKYVGPYVADNEGTLRLRCIAWASGIELQHRRADGQPFVTAYRWKWDDPSVSFLGFGGDPNTAYFLTHDNGDWGTLRGFDTTTFKLGGPLATLNGAEIKSVLFSRDRTKLLGLESIGADGEFEQWIDRDMRHHQAVVDASLPGCRNRILSWSADLNALVFLSSKGIDPGTYYSLDMRKKALVRLGRRRPQVDAATLGKMTAEDITTRDGLIIHGVLTVPSDGSKPPYPMVLIPQSGVFGRRWVIGYSATEQFLASRGYAVFQVDYRGAWGYGRTYEDAGRFQIAGKIPDDVEDAALWCVKSGNASPGRICIFGSGFAGTLALIAATHSPDLYCCVINELGEPDLTRYGGAYDWNIDWLEQKRLELFIGNDSKAFASRSPLLAIGRLRAPMLNIYSNPEHDRSWDRLESALRHNDKSYVVFKNLVPSNELLPIDYRINYYRQVETFLDKNLKNVAAN